MSETEKDKKQRKLLERKWAATFMVEESHAKAVMKFGAFERFEMSWKDHKFDDNWEVKDAPGAGAGQKAIGGLHTKWPGVEKIFAYRFRWKDIQLVEKGKDVVQFHEKMLDYIFLKPAYYAFEVEKAETSAVTERIPLTLRVSVILQVVNPYKTLFLGVPDWYGNTATRLAAMLRDWVAQKTLNEVLSFRRDPETAWDEFKDNPIIKSLEKDWGIRVQEKGIDIRDVDLPKEYEEAAALEKKKKLEAEAKKARIEIESQARASEVVGTMVQMIFQNTGMPIRKIRKQLRDDPEKFFEKYKPILERNYKLLADKIAIEEGAYVKIDVQGAEGIEKALLNIITAWQRMPMGRREKKEAETREETPRRERKKLAEEDLEKAREDFRKIARGEYKKS